MKMSFRWYGDDDPVSLKYIKQIPQMKEVVSAIYDIPPGSVWPYEKIMGLKSQIEEAGLQLRVIESVPVHESIKMGAEDRDEYIEQYKETIKNLSRAGIKTICYNFMPVFDWTRTSLADPLPDGSHSLSYKEEMVQQVDVLSGELELPGWDLSYQTEELKHILGIYSSMSNRQLMDNLIYFLEEIIPTAEAEDVLMAIHPDDPPWPILGLPRVVTNQANLEYMLNKVNRKHNGVTFCTGSFGSNPENNLVDMAKAAEGRIHFVHMRNIKYSGPKSFQETSHSVHEGSLPLVDVVQELIRQGYEGAIRPDHGRMIWGEQGRPGYGLYDRALGAAYINGIIDTYKKEMDYGGVL